MASPLLFHGPVARGEAVRSARTMGRLVGDPIGDDGLKVNDSRLIVQLASSSGVGDQPPVVVVGPLDRATPEASDALLKTLEDLAEGPLQIVLWADSIAGVVGTIRSRTLARWCPPREGWVSPFVDDDAKELLAAFVAGDTAKCMGVLHSRKKDWGSLIQGFCEALSDHEGDIGKTTEIWTALRPVLDGKGSHLVAASAFLEVL